MTTTAVCAGLVNFFLLAYAASDLLIADAGDRSPYHLRDDAPGPAFYLKSGATFLVSVITSLSIRSSEAQATWGARLFACGIPAGAALLLLYFGWAHW
ncbi:MAG: hypothetical protein ACR2RA_01420 [Geminicoccaceae bacterium]